MLTLGVHPGYHDAAAALFDGYRLVAAVSRERLTRRKGDGRGDVPLDCVDEVLAIAGAGRRDVDLVASTRSALPQSLYTHFRGRRALEGRVRQVLGAEKLRFLSLELCRAGTTDALAIIDRDAVMAHYGFRGDVGLSFANHHEAHALPALFFTDWDEALLYTADGGGDNVQYSMRGFRDGRIETLYGGDAELMVATRIDSLGMAYGFCTQALGWRMNRHEGKLTGLAAYGEPSCYEEMAAHFKVADSGEITSDFTAWSDMRSFIVELAKRVSREDLSASVQHLLETHILASVERFLARNPSRHLGLAGGVFANVRLNRLLTEKTGVDEAFVFPAMGDDGLAVGAALDALLRRDGLARWLERRYRLADMYLGRDYADDIDRALAATPGVAVVAGDPVAAAVGRLQAGKAGAIYTRRMEYGPRALGARTILGNPTDPAINDSLNHRLQRSEFMPFAPVVAEADAAEVFEVTDANRYACRFMTITCAVKPAWRARIPAVVHVDGTARPQTITRDPNPLYFDILAGFKQATGLPVLINTSFNVHEEPIVDTPAQCRRALVDDRVDFVVTDKALYELAGRT
jgi:carbamoyltransferase